MVFKIFTLPNYDRDSGTFAAIVDVASQTGENTANIEQQQEQIDEVAAAAEAAQQAAESAQIADQITFDILLNRCNNLEERITALETKEANEEKRDPKVHESPPDDEQESGGTEIDPPPTVEKPRKKGCWPFC